MAVTQRADGAELDRGGRLGGRPSRWRGGAALATDGKWFAIGGACTHYGGGLGEGLVSDETVRCP
jgi:nitrite reductase/ring-hydroxylating ferredoxin subunit